MEITNQDVRRIIQEELSRALREADGEIEQAERPDIRDVRKVVLGLAEALHREDWPKTVLTLWSMYPNLALQMKVVYNWLNNKSDEDPGDIPLTDAAAALGAEIAELEAHGELGEQEVRLQISIGDFGDPVITIRGSEGEVVISNSTGPNDLRSAVEQAFGLEFGDIHSPHSDIVYDDEDLGFGDMPLSDVYDAVSEEDEEEDEFEEEVTPNWRDRDW